MSSNLERILTLEVPIIVQLGERLLPLGEVVALSPGAIIELTKAANEDLELLVNNKVVGKGNAVKVGENFGLKLNRIGDAEQRVRALGGMDAPAPSADSAGQASDDDIAALAAQMLAGQV